jgi:hypothetical protein
MNYVELDLGRERFLRSDFIIEAENFLERILKK